MIWVLFLVLAFAIWVSFAEILPEFDYLDYICMYFMGSISNYWLFYSNYLSKGFWVILTEELASEGFPLFGFTRWVIAVLICVLFWLTDNLFEALES